ncbi:MAG: hypothetical protein GWN46_08510 [Gammaproteobacteria bacterium]|nr:hypothetical protein [Gammaproteobacteria bacterium]
MTAITAECLCVQRSGLPVVFTDNVETPGPNENVVCYHCGRVLRTNASSAAKRPSWLDESFDIPGEQGRIAAARARAGLVRGRPFDRSPPIDPRPRPPWAPPGEPD